MSAQSLLGRAGVESRAGPASVLVLLLLVFPGLLPNGGADTAAPNQIFTVNSFDGNITDTNITLVPGVADNSTTLTFPSNTWIENASLELTSYPMTTGGTDYPTGPSLDVGADNSTDWAFDGFAYGAMGFQDLFHDGTSTTTQYNLSFSAGEEKTLTTRLSANATIINASLTLGGWPTPYWSDPRTVTPGDGSPGESSPAFCSTGDRLWVAWASKDPALVHGSDWDILVSWSADGSSWAHPVDISPANEHYEDNSPDIIAYDGKIYVAWNAADTTSSFSAGNIYIRCWDGSQWESAVRLTPPGLFFENDWPRMVVYDGRLFLFWRTTDPSQANIAFGDDMDMVYRTFDGQAWSAVTEVTPYYDSGIDWSLEPIVFDGRLYFFYDAETGLRPGSAMDIYYRAFDGTGWGDPVDIIPQPDYEQDEIPQASVYHDPVTGQDELWVSWVRGNPSLHDLHIMARGFDGSSWGAVTELTDPSNPQDNMGQEMVEYDGRLYVVWVTGTNTSEESSNTISVYNTFGHVVIRAYDGYGWSDIMELTPIGKTDNANAPTLAVYNGRLYAAWAYPTPATQGGKETWDIIARNIDFQPVEMTVTVGEGGLADWGPSGLRSTSERIPLDADVLASALASAPRQTDRYGNEYCDLPIRLLSANPSQVSVGNLSIVYSLTARLDNLTTVLNGLLRAGMGAGRDAGDNTTLPLSLEASSTGKLRMHDLNITYIIDLPPVLILDIPDLHFKEDTVAVHLIDLDKHFWDDWDAGNLDYVVTIEQDPTRIHAIVDGHYLTFTLPTKYWYGSERFQVRAYDRARLWANSNIFNITVDHVNHPPVLDPIPARKVDVGTRVYFLVHATDPDNDTLTFFSNENLIPVLPLAGRLNTGFVAFTPDRTGTLLLNITVDDGNGGNDTKTARILAVEGVSSAMNELCPTWLVIIAIAAAAVVAAEYYRRKYLRETGPVIGPGGEFTNFAGTPRASALGGINGGEIRETPPASAGGGITEEQVFGGLVNATLSGAPVQGGSEQGNMARAQVAADGVSPAKKDLEGQRRAVEDAIRIPGHGDPGTGNR